MQFRGLRNAVVIIVDPEQQVRKDRVVLIDDSVAVPAVFRLVELR